MVFFLSSNNNPSKQEMYHKAEIQTNEILSLMDRNLKLASYKRSFRPTTDHMARQYNYKPYNNQRLFINVTIPIEIIDETTPLAILTLHILMKTVKDGKLPMSINVYTMDEFRMAINFFDEVSRHITDESRVDLPAN